MDILFALLFFVAIIATIILLIKPSLTSRSGKAALSRGKIGLYGLTVIIVCFAMVGVFAPKVDPQKLAVEQFSDDKTKVTQHGNVIEIAPIEEDKPEKTQAEIDQEAEQYRLNVEAQQQALADEDRPHFEWPKVDYTKAVAKVNLHNDKAILKAAGKPVTDQENSTNQNGKPMVSYWFSKDLTNYLQIDLSREFIDVAWRFDAKDQAKATASFNDGQRITRALLGGQDGGALYENIAQGGKIDELNLEDGTVIKNARCGQFMCRYQIVRN